MTEYGVDTTFLAQVELKELPEHKAARSFLSKNIITGAAKLAISPQVLIEFIHIITDPKRFSEPLTIEQAIERAEFWWNAREVMQINPHPNTTALTFAWLKEFKLGRKRLLDTQLAATYYLAGVTNILSSNIRDFKVYGYFSISNPADL